MFQTMPKIQESPAGNTVDMSHKIASTRCASCRLRSVSARHQGWRRARRSLLSRLCYKPAGIKRTRSSWTRMIITAFVMIRNQSGAQATGALEFPRSSSEDRHVPLVFFRSPPRHLKRSVRLRVLSKVFYGVPGGYEKWISGNKSTSWMTSRTHMAFSKHLMIQMHYERFQNSVSIHLWINVETSKFFHNHISESLSALLKE